MSTDRRRQPLFGGASIGGIDESANYYSLNKSTGCAGDVVATRPTIQTRVLPYRLTGIVAAANRRQQQLAVPLVYVHRCKYIYDSRGRVISD